MSLFTASLIGKRKQNEDKHRVIVNINGEDSTKAPINYYGVYDGHGGKFVSKFLHDNLPDTFMNKKISYPLKKTFAQAVYKYFQNILKEQHLQLASNAGSTCLSVIHYKHGDVQHLNILNVGDSRCIICRNNIGIPLTKDHKPNWTEEHSRIKLLGGDIVFDGYDWRIQDLSVSRAFGDITCEPYVTCDPEVFRYTITNDDKFIVLGCDGLWDVMTNQDVVNYILENCYDLTIKNRINTNINIAKKLANFAIERGSTDNITIVIVFLK